LSNHYLIHLPHCGTKIPDKYLNDYFLEKIELEHNIYNYCDLYTDELFNEMFKNFDGVKNPYSRLFFDPERFENDDEEQMYKEYRLGWFYENSILSKKSLRNTNNKSTIRQYFDNHHKELNKKTKEKLKLHDRCTVIDCHSFSNERYSRI